MHSCQVKSFYLWQINQMNFNKILNNQPNEANK